MSSYGVRMFHAAAAVVSDYHARSKAFIDALASGGDYLQVSQKRAYDRLVRDFSGEHNQNHATLDIWSKGRAGYPVIGGTASAHKWNMFDLRDMDAAYRLTFVGSPTHSATGMQPNGINQYARTYFNMLSANPNSHCIVYYSGTNNTATGEWVEMGGITSGTLNGATIQCRNNASNAATRNMNANLQAVSSRSDGLFISNKQSASVTRLLRNNTLLTSGNSGGVPATVELALFAAYLGGSIFAASYSSRECRFAAIFAGLSTQEEAALYNAIQAYQTALNRQV